MQSDEAVQTWSVFPIGAPWNPAMLFGDSFESKQNTEKADDLTLCKIRLNAANILAARQQVCINLFLLHFLFLF